MPQRTRNNSPSPSPAGRSSSPLSSGSLVSYPVTTISFQSSPDLSHSDPESHDSPDYLEPFEYTSDMECDFRRIDAEAAQLGSDDPFLSSNTELNSSLPPPSQAGPQSPARTDSPPPSGIDSPPLTLRRKQKTWVVFQGREPGVYDCMYVFHTM